MASDDKHLFFARHTPQGNQFHWVAVSSVEKLKPR